MKAVMLPRSLTELWSCLKEEPQAALYAGGTDFLVQMRTADKHPPTLICLERISEMKGIREKKNSLWLGAGNTHTQLLNNPLVNRHLPVLVKALQKLGSPTIRNMGTIGGNICTASPAADSLPALYVLEAELELISIKATRYMPISDFITGPGQKRLKRGEILSGIRIKKPTSFNVHHFEKIGQRQAMACAIASMACLLRLSKSGAIESARLAWGSVGPTIVTASAIEGALSGKKISRQTLARASAIATQLVSPIDDIRASADYRRSVSGNLLFRILDYKDSVPSRFA